MINVVLVKLFPAGVGGEEDIGKAAGLKFPVLSVGGLWSETTQPNQLQGFLLPGAFLDHTAQPVVSIAGLGELTASLFLILRVPGSVFSCLAEAGCISRGCSAFGRH